MALPDIITVEELFSPPERAGARISPDGTRIAYVAPWKDRLNVWVRSADPEASGPASDARCVTADESRSVISFHWTDDPRWLLYVQDAGGDENWHLYRIDLDDPDAPAVDLTPIPGVRMWGLEQPARRPGKAVVQLNTREPGVIDLHELDIATGELTMLARNPGTVNTWLTGPDAEPFAYGLTDSGDIELSRLDTETGTLETVVTYDGSDHPLGISPMQVTPDGTGIWLGSNRGTDRTRLVRLDLATGEEVEVDSHPTFDLVPGPATPLIEHPRTGELLGVRYVGERQVVHAVDPHFADVLEKLRTLSDGDLGPVSCDDAGQRWVVSFVHDREPFATWLYDHATGDARLLFLPFPHLDPGALAPMEPVTITARDGLSLPAYLTLPVGIEPTGLPLVLNVHGGPWMRESWGFDPFTQLMANRGHAVLTVNFRGSTGYGKAHTKAAIGEFAGAMHDDLIDAVDWAVEQGYADRDRVGIYGGSYGGYAALVGVTFTPDVFAAAIDYCGISDLANFMRTMPPAVRAMMANNWYRYVGDPADPAQEADMAARSPISRVEQIRTPLMVAQGANDVRVVQAESDNIVAALRSRGVEVEYLVKDDEGHGFLNPENQIDLYRVAERFLVRHLGGRGA
ncbi:dipeptidyl aminopeptidase/acylaminoacyl peptidase [Pseudonocardia sediminis]|uniref:Dipeptidyl aminopeptidase/acylaminoacyl peptidase n=1 Tax=Pseudonocardia sediminis TaxID=1397368 RepID=A0A4Q7V436_PSEST|nr:alpha/beta fold hydrolase [Pseudonocardia sediminis]RZT88855.1 dipeptidyl aminopeptidase/acylaminoacyl peptidase [Pseudonocardia sediminis]